MIVKHLGYVLQNPLFLGLNIITTRVGVSSDIIRNKEGGFFFKTQEELKLIFLELSKNPLLIQQMVNEIFKCEISLGGLLLLRSI